MRRASPSHNLYARLSESVCQSSGNCRASLATASRGFIVTHGRRKLFRCQADRERVEGRGEPRQVYSLPAALCLEQSRKLMQVPSSADFPWRMLRRIATFARAARVGRTANAPLLGAVLFHTLATQTKVTAKLSRNSQRLQGVGTMSPITGTWVDARVC